jgi:hypothetical protein
MMKMPFGKHKGAPLSAIPMSYLQWVKEFAKGPLERAIRHEIQQRRPRKKKPKAKHHRKPSFAFVDTGERANIKRRYTVLSYTDDGRPSRIDFGPACVQFSGESVFSESVPFTPGTFLYEQKVACRQDMLRNWMLGK